MVVITGLLFQGKSMPNAVAC